MSLLILCLNRNMRVVAIDINQRRALTFLERFEDLPDHQIVAAEKFDMRNPAVECHKGIAHPRRAGLAGRPFGATTRPLPFRR